MYPNPQDALPLADRPSLEFYRKRAKALVKACTSVKPDALRDFVSRWIAPPPVRDRLDAEQMQRRVNDIAQFAAKKLGDRCRLTDAQFVVARALGFTSWPKLSAHVAGLSRKESRVAAFEQAADAIVAGDAAKVKRLLRAHPNLIRARSTREHEATLLHYVSANGVENYRQKTPPNSVAIAKILLDAGAEVDAPADVYGGGSTTLGLVATSAHPRLAGVQIELIDILLAAGARLDVDGAGHKHTMVEACLANGCPEAATHLATLGAPVDFVSAAGAGRLDVVRAALEGEGKSRRRLTKAKLDDALHNAAYAGHPEIVRLLLAAGAPLNERDKTYDGTPLDWALHGWANALPGSDARYREAVAVLAQAAAVVQPDALDHPKVRSDPELRSLLASRT